MKIAVIGGGSVRTPLLVNGLAQSDLPIDEIALFDLDEARLSVMSELAEAFSPKVRACREARTCVEGASFVFLSIRVGGAAARARDEAIAVEHGTVGQETVGAGGFAMAMRTIPHAVDYARLVASEAPRAWVVNFTNPVSIITQAITSQTTARVIGICDTPTELFEDVAHALYVDSTRCFFDYFGLNHLGWLREVYCDGEPQLARLWGDATRLGRVYRAPLFDPAFLQTERLLPTEYLFYYYFPGAALENMKKAGQTRGQAILPLNDRLFADLSAAGADRRRVYREYIDSRNAGYMQIESGSTLPMARMPSANLTGYDKIALSVVRGIHFNANAVMPLNVLNRGTIRDLKDDDVVEVPCVVNANGARPLNVGCIPDRARDLIERVKDYERLTIQAALEKSHAAATRALVRNPIVGDPHLARNLVTALQPLW